MSNEIKLPALPSQFQTAALALPGQIDRVLAAIETPTEADKVDVAIEAALKLAKRLKMDTPVIDALQYARLKVVAKIGELVPAKSREESGAMKRKGGSPTEPPFAKATLATYRKVKSNEAKIDDYYQARSTEAQEDTPNLSDVGMSIAGFLRFVTGGIASSLVASEENEWYTPKKYLDAARKVLGNIDLDPASSAAANRIVKAKKYYTADDDSLNTTWNGSVWLNPPYGRLAGNFARKLVVEHEAGNVKAAIILVNAHCTDTDWFQGLWDHLLCFTDHRIDFDSAGREKPNSSTHGSVFVYMGRRNTAFIKEFATFGAVVKRA